MNDLRLFFPALILAALSACATTDGTLNPKACSGACQTHAEGYQWAMDAALMTNAPCNNAAYGADFVRGCKDAVNDFSQLQPASKGL